MHLAWVSKAPTNGILFLENFKLIGNSHARHINVHQRRVGFHTRYYLRMRTLREAADNSDISWEHIESVSSSKARLGLFSFLCTPWLTRVFTNVHSPLVDRLSHEHRYTAPSFCPSSDFRSWLRADFDRARVVGLHIQQVDYLMCLKCFCLLLAFTATYSSTSYPRREGSSSWSLYYLPLPLPRLCLRLCLHRLRCWSNKA